MSELYRDYIDGKADEIINSLGGTITPAPANAELYRDFLDRKFDDVINAISNYRTPVKSFTYNGTGLYVDRRIDIPSDCRVILSIECEYTSGNYYGVRSTENLPIRTTGKSMLSVVQYLTNLSVTRGYLVVTFHDGYITIDSNSQQYALNKSGETYTVYYI